MNRTLKIFIIGILLQAGVTPSEVWALAFDINVNTANLTGKPATLAFDFTNGDGAFNNTARVANFLTDGSFDPIQAIPAGDVGGSLNSSVTFSDTSFFNELLQPITLGNAFQFRLEISDLFAGGIPDAFSFFILDSNLMPLVSTDDPSGGDALFALDLNGRGNLSVYASTQASWSITPVPEPDSFALILIGFWSLYSRNKRQHSSKRRRFEI